MGKSTGEIRSFLKKNERTEEYTTSEWCIKRKGLVLFSFEIAENVQGLLAIELILLHKNNKKITYKT